MKPAFFKKLFTGLSVFMMESHALGDSAILRVSTMPDSAGRSATAIIAPASQKAMTPVLQSTAPSFSNMSGLSTFISNTANNCSNKPTPDPCFVALTATAGATDTNNIPNCPDGYTNLFGTGTSVLDSSGNQLNYTAAFTRNVASLDEYNFYTNNNTFTCTTSGSVVIVGPTALDGTQAGSSCGIFCINGASYPSVTQYEGHNKNDKFVVNGNYMSLTGVTNNGFSCWTLPHVAAPNSSCDNKVAGAYWETHAQGTFSYLTCTRNEGFYPNISNPNGYSLPTTSNKYVSPTVSICGKLNYSTKWVNN